MALGRTDHSGPRTPPGATRRKRLTTASRTYDPRTQEKPDRPAQHPCPPTGPSRSPPITRHSPLLRRRIGDLRLSLDSPICGVASVTRWVRWQSGGA
jgi:hypothetical protein